MQNEHSIKRSDQLRYHMTHAILIAPKAFQAAANSLGEALGHGPDTYSVPLYTGTDISHYAGCTPVSDLFVSQVTGAMAGELPDSLSEYSIEQVQGLISQLIIDFSNDVEGSQHFEQVLAEHSLSVSPE